MDNLSNRTTLHDDSLIWKPFGSAPLNGTEILVWREDAGVFVAFYSPDDEIWFATSGEDLTGDLPTHWMDIPEPPAGGLQRGQDIVTRWRATWDSD